MASKPTAVIGPNTKSIWPIKRKVLNNPGEPIETWKQRVNARLQLLRILFSFGDSDQPIPAEFILEGDETKLETLIDEANSDIQVWRTNRERG